MAGKRQDSSSLADPREALSFYLDSLLADVPVEEADDAPPAVDEPAADSKKPAAVATDTSHLAASRSVPEIPAAQSLPVTRDDAAGRPFAEPRRSQPLLTGPALFPLLVADSPAAEIAQEAAAAEAPPLPAQTRDQAVTPLVAPETAADVFAEIPSAGHGKEATPPGEAPAWAGHDFQCLTFMVAGVTLAAPLERLHGIVEWHGELTELPGYAEWFMGLLPNRGQNVRVIDTAQIVMPDGRRPDARPALERVKYVVLIDGGRWGLAADAIAQVLTLAPDGVRWRGERGRRPWLAGTAVEQMCAVLDIDNLSEQLALGLKDNV